MKIGLMTETSGRCDPPSKGSLKTNTSPGRIVSPNLRWVATMRSWKVPVNTVMPLVCDNSWASASVMPQAKSSTS